MAVGRLYGNHLGGSFSSCTCASNWIAPVGWTGGSGPVAIIEFEDTSCFSWMGGDESTMKVAGHVSCPINNIKDSRYS